MMVFMMVIIFLDSTVNNETLPYIKVRKNAKVRWKRGNILRNLSVLDQRNYLQKWKKNSVICGNTWIVKIVFSCIKKDLKSTYTRLN